jgi:hypothetical protein
MPSIMSLKFLSATPLLAACGAATAIALGAPASATPDQCTPSGGATVCEQPGNTNVVTNPPQGAGGQAGGVGGGANVQNGNYGPAGDLPPVGD